MNQEEKWVVKSHQQQNLEDVDAWLELTDGKTSLLSHMDGEDTMQIVADLLNDTGVDIYVDKSNEAAACHVASHLEEENKRMAAEITDLNQSLKTGSWRLRRW